MTFWEAWTVWVTVRGWKQPAAEPGRLFGASRKRWTRIKHAVLRGGRTCKPVAAGELSSCGCHSLIPHKSCCQHWHSAALLPLIHYDDETSHLITINNLRQFNKKAVWSGNLIVKRLKGGTSSPVRAERRAICMPEETKTNWTRLYAALDISLSGLIMEA